MPARSAAPSVSTDSRSRATRPGPQWGSRPRRCLSRSSRSSPPAGWCYGRVGRDRERRASETWLIAITRQHAGLALLLFGALVYALGPGSTSIAGLVLFLGGAAVAPRAALILAVISVPAYLNGRDVGGYRLPPHTIAI